MPSPSAKFLGPLYHIPRSFSTKSPEKSRKTEEETSSSVSDILYFLPFQTYHQTALLCIVAA